MKSTAIFCCLLVLCSSSYGMMVDCSLTFGELSAEITRVICPNTCGNMRIPPLCGTTTFTNTSRICVAAIYDGKIRQEAGGLIVVHRGPGQGSYVGGRQNGIRSDSCTSNGPSFSLVASISATVFYVKPDSAGPTDCSDPASIPDYTNTCPTHSSHCMNGGTCIDAVNIFYCSCPPHMAGDLCQFDINTCRSDPCLNGGTCSNGQNDFHCQCTDQFTGTTCDADISTCYSGISNGSVTDNQMTASSSWGPPLAPPNGRLNKIPVGSNAAAWAGKRKRAGAWLQVDFGTELSIYGVVTQGRSNRKDPRGNDQWVTAYKASYSNDGTTFHYIQNSVGQDIVFHGNSDTEAIKTNRFPIPVNARYWRLTVVSFHKFPSLRLEYLTC